MPARRAAQLLRVLASHDVTACVGGGWGVDALLGRQTREHEDLDLWVDAGSFEHLIAAFADHGVDRVFPWPGGRPWNFVLHDGGHARVDLHIFESLPDGSLHFGSVVDPFILPASALTHSGTIDEQAVRCETPEWAVRFHTGYRPRPRDRHDVRLLCERFGLQLPDAYI